MSGALDRLKATVFDTLRRAGSGRAVPGAGAKSSKTPKARPGRGRAGAGDQRAGDLDVAYAPEHDGQPDPGEVVWTWVPYEEDPSQGKDRPVLILGTEAGRFVAVPLSSKDHTQRRDSYEWIEVGTGAWDADHRTSYANASRLLRVDSAAVRREGSALDRGRFDAVVAKVAELHAWHSD